MVWVCLCVFGFFVVCIVKLWLLAIVPTLTQILIIQSFQRKLGGQKLENNRHFHSFTLLLKIGNRNIVLKHLFDREVILGLSTAHQVSLQVLL